MAHIENITPEFVKRDSLIADADYVQWLTDVKARFREGQARAAVKVNTEMLRFYWSIGRDLVALRAETRWGSGVVKQFAFDMREAFPAATGFSFSNVKYMKQWYSFYAGDEKSQRTIGQITKSQQAVGQIEMPEIFGRVPWGQHIDIISKCTSVEEALFYADKVASEGWSRPVLNVQLDTHLFQRQGTIHSNFTDTLPAKQSQSAQQLFKDPYHFEFLSLQENYTEHELEEALVQNITHFLLELGSGFAYVGRQMELRMDDGTAFFPDLVFYHIPQKRYVIIELKAVEFMPEFAGKLNFYVSAADHLLKGDGDNPSIGIIICKTAKKTVVEWSLKGIQKPLGVATYQIEQIVERTVKELEQKKKEKDQEM